MGVVCQAYVWFLRRVNECMNGVYLYPDTESYLLVHSSLYLL